MSIKNITIPLETKEKLLLIECPEDARGFRRSEQGHIVYLYGKGAENFLAIIKHPFEIFMGCYFPFVPFLDSIDFAEKIKKEWVISRCHNTKPEIRYYFNYPSGVCTYRTAKESLISLLLSQSLLAFPLTEEKRNNQPVAENFGEDYRQWVKSEFKVMPKKFIVLFIK